MKIADYKGYEIHLPTSGGKAGKGHAVTSHIQVRNGDFIIHQFRFAVAEKESRQAAMKSARAFIDEREVALDECN